MRLVTSTGPDFTRDATSSRHPDRGGARRDVTYLVGRILFANRVGSLQPDANFEALRIEWKPNETASGKALLDVAEVIEHERIDVRLVQVPNQRARAGAFRSVLCDHVRDHRQVFDLGRGPCVRLRRAHETYRHGRSNHRALPGI
jgi:hypothetical protein